MSENFSVAVKVALYASLLAAFNSPLSLTVAPAGAEPATTGSASSRPAVPSGNVVVSPDGKFTPIGDAGAGANNAAAKIDDKAVAAEIPASEEVAEKTAEEIAAEAKAERQRKREAAASAADALHNEALDHFELARHYISRWNAEMAEVELQAAIMCEPKIKAVHRDYVLVALMRGNFGKALAEAMMVVGLGEPIPLDDKQKDKLKEAACKAHYVKGIALARESKWQDALVEFQWALSYQPNNARVSRSIAFAYASLGDFNRAEKEYASSFALDPSDAFAHADLAFLLQKSGDTTRAMAQLEEAVRLQPDVAALHVDLAWLAESKGDLDLASAEFEKAVKLSPKHAALWTHLGKLFARQGLNDKAVEAYKSALNLDPTQQDAEQGLNSIESRPGANGNKA